MTKYIKWKTDGHWVLALHKTKGWKYAGLLTKYRPEDQEKLLERVGKAVKL